MKARAESRNPGFRSSPGGAAADRWRKFPNRKLRHLDGTRTPMRGETNACFPKVRSPIIHPAPFAKTRQSLDSGSPRALAGKKRRTSKRLRERSKIRSSDNRARSGRNDGPLENPRSRRTPQTESRHSGKEKKRLKNYPPFRGIFITQVLVYDAIYHPASLLFSTTVSCRNPCRKSVSFRFRMRDRTGRSARRENSACRRTL